jgi:hypothetical protein
MDAYQDGMNAERYGSDYKLVRSQVNQSAKPKIHFAGRRWAARIHH